MSTEKQDKQATCPNCGLTAKTRRVISLRFGYRVENGVERVQSWCRFCRNDAKRMVVSVEMEAAP